LVEAAADAIDGVVVEMQGAMREASELVLPGFPLRSDVKVIRHPDRYADSRGAQFWATVQGLLEDETMPRTNAGDFPAPVRGVKSTDAGYFPAPVRSPSSLMSPGLMSLSPVSKR
jgi:hypothetical protein